MLNLEKERVYIATAHFVFEGLIVKGNDEFYKRRLSDYVNSEKARFLALTDVAVYSPDGSTIEKSPFVLINRNHIQYLRPVPSSEDKDESAE